MESSTSLISSLISGAKTYKYTIMVAGIALVGILVVLWMFFSKNPSNYQPNRELVEKESSGDVEMLLFYTTWCPHCKSAMPAWEEIKEKYSGKEVNGYRIQFTEFDCSTETPETEKWMNQYNVEGYPTIKLLKDGKIIEFDANPTVSSLDNFIQTVV